MDQGTGNSKKEKKNDSHIIPLIDLRKKGVVYEDVRRFPDSIYEHVYARAVKAVEQIAADSRKIEAFGNKEAGRKDLEIANVISFIGRRGTGKSSALLSFQKALRQYRRSRDVYYEKQELTFSRNADMEDVRFFTLDCIDAAAMEDSESVFTLVLANILVKIGEYSEQADQAESSYLKRSLQQKLGEIFKDYTSLAASQKDIGEYSAFEYLKNSASSQRIRVKFSQMVQECLQYFLECSHSSARKAFLVIAVDDLDMAHYNSRVSGCGKVNAHSYEIMREISKYFSVPGIIVLAAYNHTNLLQQCSGFFYGSLADYYRQLGTDSEALRSGEALAGEFLEKVFTPVFRLYMPSWKKRDYFERNIRIDIGSSIDADDILIRYQKAGRTVFKIKDLLLILYAEKAGIYYDYEGKKRHFLEPDSLRALNSILQILIGESVKENQGVNQLHLRKENRENVFKRIMDDVYFRFVSERLYLETERRLFSELLEQQADRRSEHIVQIVAPKIEPLGRNNKWEIRHLLEEKKRSTDNARINEINQQLKSARDNSGASYSYAELLHCIYHMTRQEKFFSKEFVACLLHSYTVCMAQIYEQSRQILEDRDIYIRKYRYHAAADSAPREQEPDIDGLDSFEQFKRRFFEDTGTEDETGYSSQIVAENEKLYRADEAYQVLKGIIGQTVLGNWTQYFFPAVKLTENADEQKEEIFAIASFHRIRGAEFQGKFMITGAAMDEDVQRMLRESIFFMSMYTDLLQWETLDIKIRTDKDSDMCQVWMEYKGETHFELTAFVKLAILYRDYLYKMEQLFTDAFLNAKKGADAGTDGVDHVVIDGICERIKAYFAKLWEAYYDWDKNYGNMVLPVHSLDLMYNLTKHQFLECREQNTVMPRQEYNEKFIDSYIDMLWKFWKRLDRADQFYCLQGNDRFAEKFFQCPYIQLLRKLNGDQKAKSFIESYIEKLIGAVHNYVVLNKPADEI